MGKNTKKSSSLCNLQYSVYRSKKRLAIYYSGNGHSEGCVPTQSDLPLGMLIQAQKANYAAPGIDIYEQCNKDSLQKLVNFNVKTQEGQRKIVDILNKHAANCHKKVEKNATNRSIV